MNHHIIRIPTLLYNHHHHHHRRGSHKDSRISMYSVSIGGSHAAPDTNDMNYCGLLSISIALYKIGKNEAIINDEWKYVPFLLLNQSDRR